MDPPGALLSSPVNRDSKKAHLQKLQLPLHGGMSVKTRGMDPGGGGVGEGSITIDLFHEVYNSYVCYVYFMNFIQEVWARHCLTV